MQIHDVVRIHPLKKNKRVGRGGKRGTYSGRGIKGQKARAGRKIRPQLRDIIKKIPKKRGYRFAPIKAKPFVVNISALEVRFEDGETVSPQTLVTRRLISSRKGARQLVKVLGQGTLSKKLAVSGCFVSQSAREAIEKAGGTVLKVPKMPRRSN